MVVVRAKRSFFCCNPINHRLERRSTMLGSIYVLIKLPSMTDTCARIRRHSILPKMATNRSTFAVGERPKPARGTVTRINPAQGNCSAAPRGSLGARKLDSGLIEGGRVGRLRDPHQVE